MIYRVISELWVLYRNRIIAAGILSVAAALLVWLNSFYFSDILSKKQKMWGEFRQEIKRNPSAAKVSSFDSAVAGLNDFDSRIPDTKGFAKVIGDIFSTAENNSLSVASVTYKPGKSQSGYLQYSFNVDVSGTYPALKSFLVELLKNPEMISVENVSFNKSGKVFENEVSMKAALIMMFRESSK